MMPASVQCPMDREVKPMTDCITCRNHIKNGVSIQWCGYKSQKGPMKEPQRDAWGNTKRTQVDELLKKADYFYKTGKPRIAENYSIQAEKIQREIKRRESH